MFVVSFFLARFDEIMIKSDALDGETRITGTVRQLRGMNGIDLHGELQYPLASLMRWKGLQSQGCDQAVGCVGYRCNVHDR